LLEKENFFSPEVLLLISGRGICSVDACRYGAGVIKSFLEKKIDSAPCKYVGIFYLVAIGSLKY
jgi:hypothetical protein